VTTADFVCQINLDLQMPVLVDGIDNPVEESYIALPMRLYLIGRDGRIVDTGDRGPFGFNPDTELLSDIIRHD
jgi:hypothetical protein